MRRRMLTRTGASLAVVAAVFGAGCAGGGGTGSPATSGGSGTTASAAWVASTVDVDGVPVAVWCRGQATDKVPVVFVSGVGLDAQAGWLDSGVPDTVATTTKACVYDRPGLGKSGAAKNERTVDNHVAELTAVLDGAGLQGKVVLVAQGYGTFIARQFASPKDHLDRTAGLLLLDPPLWPLPVDVPDGLTDGQKAEYGSIDLLNDNLSLYGAGALAPPPRPVRIVGVDALLPSRPGGPSPATTAKPTTTTAAPTTTAPPTTEADPDASDPDATQPDATQPDAPGDTEPPPESTAGTTDTTRAPGTTTAGTTPVPGVVPRTDERHADQLLLSQKGPFAKFEAIDGVGSEVQFWDAAVVVRLIEALLAG